MELDKIYNVDCFEYLQQIENDSIDLIVTDPPYIVCTTGGGGTINSVMELDKSLKALDEANISSGYDIEELARHISRIQGGKINAYFWCSKAQIPEYFRVYVGLYSCKFDILCWHKYNALPSYCNKYLTDTEYLLYFHKIGGLHPSTYEDARTYEVGVINLKDKIKYKHPTIKPLPFTQRIIRNSSEKGMVVLDPFMGSGTTAVACIREERHFIGFEISPEYYKIACNRIKDEQSQLTLF